MGFVIYTYPKGSFDAVEASMRRTGFVISRELGRGDVSRIMVTKGVSRAEIVDFSERESETRLVIMNGRKSLFTALAMWPVDVWLGRAVERHLMADGACMLDFIKEEANQSPQTTPLKRRV
jgi:hypothetical protein